MTLPLQQSPAVARALTAFGSEVSCDAPVTLNRHFGPLGRVGFTSRGPLCKTPLRDLRHAGLRIFNAEHDCAVHYKAAGFRQIITPVHIADWDLTGFAQDRRHQMHQKWRNQLRRAKTSNLRVREIAWDGSGHPLFHHSVKLAQIRKFRALPTGLIAAFAQSCFDDRRNNREFWYFAIKAYNSRPGPSLSEQILIDHDVYVGMRDRREFDLARHLFDLVIWVDRSEFVPAEGAASNQLTAADADWVLDNNGTPDAMAGRIAEWFLDVQYPQSF